MSGGAARIGRAVALVWRAAPRLAAASVAVAVLEALLPLLALLVLRTLVDALAAAAAGRPAPGALRAVALLAAVGVAVAGVRAAATWIHEALALSVTDRVQALIHRKSIALELAFFEGPEYQDRLHRAQREGSQRPARVVSALQRLATGTLSLAGIAVLLLVTQPWLLALVALASLLPLALRLPYSRELFAWRTGRTPSERLALLYEAVLTHVGYAKELRVLDLGALFLERHRELRRTLREERLRQARRRALLDLASAAGAVLAFAAALVLLVARVVEGALSLGGLVMCYQALQRALGVGQQIAASLAELLENSLFLAHLEELLDRQPLIADPASPLPLLPEANEAASFEDVTFRYPGAEEDAVSGVSFSLRRGEVVALVGENGAGKSTLVKLLCRLYEPGRGRVRVSGRDVRDVLLAELHRSMSVVFQDPVRFPVSAHENLALGDVQRLQDRAAARAAAERAGIAARLERLRDGYDALLHRGLAGGQELSAGEWQRLALARAFFRDAKVLVLDEPACALDAFAEATLVQRLRELARGRAVLLVSHRFSSVALADRIVVLERGRVRECGRHEELLRLGGSYAALYETQSRFYERPASRARGTA